MDSPSSAPPLWQLFLDWIVDRFQDVLHPADRAKVPRWMRELYAAGERPTAAEMRAYLRTRHPTWRPSGEIVVRAWSKILANPMHAFRVPPRYRRARHPFHISEDLIIEHGWSLSRIGSPAS